MWKGSVLFVGQMAKLIAPSPKNSLQINLSNYILCKNNCKTVKSKEDTAALTRVVSG